MKACHLFALSGIQAMHSLIQLKTETMVHDAQPLTQQILEPTQHLLAPSHTSPVERKSINCHLKAT